MVGGSWRQSCGARDWRSEILVAKVSVDIRRRRNREGIVEARLILVRALPTAVVCGGRHEGRDLRSVRVSRLEQIE